MKVRGGMRSGDGVQLTLDRALPLDPIAISALPILARRRLYDELGLDHLQRGAAEQAAQAIIRGEYRRGER